MPSILGICETELDVDARKLSRKRRAPTKIKEFFGGKAVLESTNDVISDYSRIYFESLDCIINAIEDRFDQEDFRTYVKHENLISIYIYIHTYIHIHTCIHVYVIYKTGFKYS